MVSLTVYDGAHWIGGNKIYLEEGGNGVVDLPREIDSLGLNLSCCNLGQLSRQH